MPSLLYLFSLSFRSRSPAIVHSFIWYWAVLLIKTYWITFWVRSSIIVWIQFHLINEWESKTNAKCVVRFCTFKLVMGASYLLTNYMGRFFVLLAVNNLVNISPYLHILTLTQSAQRREREGEIQIVSVLLVWWEGINYFMCLYPFISVYWMIMRLLLLPLLSSGHELKLVMREWSWFLSEHRINFEFHIQICIQVSPSSVCPPSSPSKHLSHTIQFNLALLCISFNKSHTHTQCTWKQQTFHIKHRSD